MKRTPEIRINTPCQEDWDAMQPVERGKFCSKCSKEVVDFTRFTDGELKAYFDELAGSGIKLCGRFNVEQVAEPIIQIPVHIHNNSFTPRQIIWLSILISFGVLLNVTSCTTSNDQKTDTPTEKVVLVLADTLETADITEINPAANEKVRESLQSVSKPSELFSDTNYFNVEMVDIAVHGMIMIGEVDPDPTSDIASMMYAGDSTYGTLVNPVEFPSQMATFPDGYEQFQQYILNNIKMPEAQNPGELENRVSYFTLIVDTEGNIRNPEIIKSAGDSAMDQEVSRVLLSSPKWIPAEHFGRRVCSVLRLPVRYKFRK